MKLQSIIVIVLTILTVHAFGDNTQREIKSSVLCSQSSGIPDEIKAAMESLRASLVELCSEYPEMADANDIHINGTLTDTPLYGFDYFHNCKDWGKRGHEETGPNAIHVGFRMTQKKEFDFECTVPMKTWSNLNLTCWTHLYFGKNPSSGLQEKLETLLQQANDKIDELEAKEKDNWGEVVEGLQCRLRSDRQVYKLGEFPVFELDLRNNGQKDIDYFPIAGVHCGVELDGQWYISREPVLWDGPNYILKKGEEVRKAIVIDLSKKWLSKEDGTPLNLAQGKHTVRVRFVPEFMGMKSYFSGKKLLSVVSNPLDIEILPAEASAVKPEEQDAWGEAVEGVQIGIIEAGQVWGRSDWPHPVVRLKLQARNDGERYLHLPENGLNWQIEVDGVWYEWADPRVYNKTKRITKEPIVSKGGRLLDFNSGDSHSDLTVEIAGNWRKIPSGKEAEFAQRRYGGGWGVLGDDYGEELILKEGQTYRIRAAIPCPPSRAGRYDTLRLISNSAEIEIWSKENAAVQAEKETIDVNFESLSVEISGIWRWWQKPLLKIRGDGRVEFSMNKGPNDPNRYESTFTLKQEHLGNLNSLLENTGWLTEPGANVQPGYTDASKIDITLHRQGQVKKVWCHDRNAEPYGALVTFIEQIYRQEDLLRRMTLDEGKERAHAAYQIQDELKAIQGEPVAAGSIRILDYERFVPVCTEILSNTDANHRETIKAALWLLTYLREESQRDLITKLITAEQTANDPQFSETKTIDTQVAAINALAALGGEKSIRHIRRLAKGHAEKKVWVNDAIVEALLELDGINSIDLLSSMLQTTRSAGWALIRLGEPAIPAIVDILEEMPPMPYRSMGQIFLIRQYIDHWDNVPKPVDARVINAVQDNLYYRLSFSTDWTQYHQEFLKLSNTPEQKYPDSRQIAEQFLIAIKNDNDKLIRKITHPVQSDWQERLTHLRQLPDLEKLEIVDVCTDQTNNFAWAVNFDINNLSAYDNYVLIILNLTSGKVWQVVNISIEDTPLLAERAYRRYLEKHPNAKQISSQIPTMQVEGEKQAKVQDSKNIILQLVGPDGQPVVGAEVGSGYLETRDDISEGIIYQLHPVTSPTGQSCVSDEKGQIILPYDERRFRYAPRWDIQIYHFEKRLGTFETLTKNFVNHEVECLLRPLCHLHGTLYSSELNKTGHNLTLTNVYVYKGQKRPLLHSSTENHFDFLVPPGQYDLWIPSSGHGVRTKRNFTKSVSIESGQIEMDLGAIDLPASKVSSLIGQPAPEIGPFQTWINGPATQLSDLKGKVVLLHFAGGSPGIPRDYTQLIKLHEEFNDKGLKIIVIHTHPSDRTEFERRFNEDFKGYGRLEDVQFLIAIDGKKSSNVEFRGARMNLSGATHITYEIDNLPTNVLIDQQGMIAGQFVFDDGEAEKAIDALLSDQISAEQIEGKFSGHWSVDVSEDHIRQFYEENREKIFTSTPTIWVKMIVTPDEESARQACHRARAGENFDKLIAEYFVPYFADNSEDRYVEKRVEAFINKPEQFWCGNLLVEMKPGDISDPVLRFGEGPEWAVLKIISVTEGHVAELGDVRDNIYQALWLKAADRTMYKEVNMGNNPWCGTCRRKYDINGQFWQLAQKYDKEDRIDKAVSACLLALTESIDLKKMKQYENGLYPEEQYLVNQGMDILRFYLGGFSEYTSLGPTVRSPYGQLGRFEEERATSLLLELSNNGDYKAAYVLASRKNQQVIPALRRLLEDKRIHINERHQGDEVSFYASYYVREHAKRAMELLGENADGVKVVIGIVVTKNKKESPKG